MASDRLRKFGYGTGLTLVALGTGMLAAEAFAPGGFVTMLGLTAIGVTKVTE